MSAWWLLIHEDETMLEVVQGILESVFPDEAVESVTDLASALDCLDQRGRANCRLIVSSISAPLNADQPMPVDRSKPTIVEFVRQHVRRSGDQPPCIFLVTYADSARMEELNRLSNSELLPVRQMFKELASTAERLLRGVDKAGADLLQVVDVEIMLRSAGSHWSVHARTGSDAGPIDIDPTALANLLFFSSLAHEGQRVLDRLGRDLYEQLMAHNVKSGLELALTTMLTQMRGQHKCDVIPRIRFNVDRETHPLLVEALGKPGQKSSDQMDFWALRAPMFRKFGDSAGRSPLFKDVLSRSAELQCLVIQGETRAFTAGSPVAKGFNALGMAVDETHWLGGYLEDNRTAFRIASCRVLTPADAGGDGYGDLVRRELASWPYHLIHYIGHSAIGSDDAGYLVLGDGPHDLLSVGEFSTLTTAAQFVFLNSCQSADVRFIMRLVENGIPAVCGYAWPIDDGVAGAFSKNFYENLFEGSLSRRYLEYSFMCAKSQLFQTCREQSSPVWAAPLLFMQKLDQERG